MNEQLIVKNFGPIKDATVDFKRVTVFIGPTGGGKSTLAKLAAVFRDASQYDVTNDNNIKSKSAYKEFLLMGHFTGDTSLKFNSKSSLIKFEDNDFVIELQEPNKGSMEGDFAEVEKIVGKLESLISKHSYTLDKKEKKVVAEEYARLRFKATQLFNKTASSYATQLAPSRSHYLPAERAFVPSLEYSWAGLMRDDIGLPKLLLQFANSFSLSRKEVPELDIPFLNVKYLHIDGRDFIKIPEREEPLMLLETASGIQSVTPLLVLLEHLSRNTEQAQSFIIEEPELNLYPTAQQGLLNWLVEKCTKGENDLTITTHSPYLLAHFNLLLYAHQVAKNHPDRADDVAKIVPRESWIDPKEFAAYHVEGQQENGVRSIINSETGLISHNSLDSTASAETAEFEKLLDINAGLEVE